jgi:RNA polymerase sigma-70 factor, ECF subfamily
MICMPIRKERVVGGNPWGAQRSITQQSNAGSSTRKLENQFDALIQQFRAPLVAFLCRLLDDQRRAEDVAVETFVRLYHHAVRGGADRDFAVALYRVAIAVAAQRDVAQPEHFERSAALLLGTRSNVQAIVQHCMVGLPESERLALLLHKYQNLTCAQIGSVLSLNEMEVRALLFRAYKTVQERLSESNGGG